MLVNTFQRNKYFSKPIQNSKVRINPSNVSYYLSDFWLNLEADEYDEIKAHCYPNINEKFKLVG